MGRRLIGWIAAYALVLQAMLAGIVTAQALGRANGAGAHGFELCLTDPDGSTLPGQSRHENCAMHCATLAGGFAALALALIGFIVFPPRRAPRVPRLVFRPTIDLLCRAGRSRAPPLPA